MQAEIEAKFLNIDIEDVRERLQEAGADCEHPMRLQRRVNIETPEQRAEHAWIRVRDEGNRTTLTYKRRNDPKAVDAIDNVKEIEVEVSDFDKTVELLREAGWDYRTFQESRRETWKLDEAEVVIDEWPWLEPYIEIEAEDEQAVRRAAEKLGFDWADAFFGHVDNVYELKYKFSSDVRGVIDIKEVRFDDPVPEQFLAKK